MHIDAILREGDGDGRRKFQWTVVFGPLALNQQGALDVDDEASWCAVQILSPFFFCPKVDDVIQGDRRVTARANHVQGNLLTLVQTPVRGDMIELAADEGTMGQASQMTHKVPDVRLLALLKVVPKRLQRGQVPEGNGFVFLQKGAYSLVCATPGNGGIFGMCSSPTPASESGVPKAEILGVKEPTGQSLPNHINVDGQMWKVPLKCQELVENGFHAFEIDKKLLTLCTVPPSLKSSARCPKVMLA